MEVMILCQLRKKNNVKLVIYVSYNSFLTGMKSCDGIPSTFYIHIFLLIILLSFYVFVCSQTKFFAQIPIRDLKIL